MATTFIAEADAPISRRDEVEQHNGSPVETFLDTETVQVGPCSSTLEGNNTNNSEEMQVSELGKEVAELDEIPRK
uniref:Uncharacterized protein n=1 Tax=Oryza glumipatula TaxID=40148 RepID=A0A0D9YFA8_9ORYZ